MSPRALLFALALWVAGAGCSHNPPGVGPGSTPPGQACAASADCGCWTCNCQGVGGAPGGAQLCVSGKCPTGEEACAPVCAIAGAPLQSATSSDSCPARNQP